MARGVIQFSITDAAGNVVPEASVEVRNSDTLSLVGLWEQRSGGDALGNPAQADEDGYFRAYCNPQRVNITATLGEFERTWMDVAVIDEVRELPVFDSGTWDPEITFATPGDLSVSYAGRTARWVRVGSFLYFNLVVIFTPTFSTASGQFRVLTPVFSSFDATVQLPVGTAEFTTNAPNAPDSNPHLVARIIADGSFLFISSSNSGVAGASILASGFNGAGSTQYIVRIQGGWISG